MGSRLRGCSLAIAALALGVLGASVLPGCCPFRAAANAQQQPTLAGALGRISDATAAALGLEPGGGALTTVAGASEGGWPGRRLWLAGQRAAVDPAPLIAKLAARIQCSAHLCVDMDKYAWHTDLADWNARVLLWSPKMPDLPAGRAYDPSDKDWASVVGTCRQLFQYEKRLASFFMRAAFHDSMAVDVSQCPGPNCGGADASLLLSIAELTRPENAEDSFAALAARAAKKIASFFDVSVADTLAVCAAVAPEVLSKGRIKILTGSGPGVLRVGRLDSTLPAPPGNLPAANSTLEQFAAFWTARGISATEATALMGSHALIDDQRRAAAEGRLTLLISARLRATCVTVSAMSAMRLGAEGSPENRCRMSEARRAVSAWWWEEEEEEEALGPAAPAGPSVSDAAAAAAASAGAVCISCGRGAGPGEGVARAQDSPAKADWDSAFRSAFIKMVTAFARWPAKQPFLINGGECATGLHLEAACAQAAAGPAAADVKTLDAATYTPPSGPLRASCRSCSQGLCAEAKQCGQCVNLFNAALRPQANPLVTEARCCGCATLSRDLTYNATVDAAGNTNVIKTDFVVRWPDVMPFTLPPEPLPAAAAGPVPERQPSTFAFNDNVAPTVTVLPAGSNPPLAPEGDASVICPAADGTIVEVRGYPSSPFKWTPFTQPYANPPPGTNLTVDAYEVDIYATAKDIGCPAGKPTWLLTYNGSVPGPSFRVLKGRQTLVRFNNRLTPANLTGTPFSEFHPCEGTRSGRPISVHLHGSASLAPYDGWAEDTTCGAETKDYYYPNWRAGFSWYHDHQLDITSENAYFGLSGMFKDAVLDSNCQLYYDRAGPHRNNLYGDINFVNGIPWPVATMEPRWTRFRWLVSSVSRPYKLRFVDAATGADVGGAVCQVIAGDGGIRRTPVAFPAAGLFMGVAERYEVVCDFSAYSGRDVYLVNAYDDDRMKDVPFFCNSHLFMKINVRCNGTGPAGACAPPANAAFTPLVPAQPTLDRVLNQTDIAAALTLARNRQCTRTFRFGRRNGHWVINGESWHTVRVAAADIGHNTWEVWCLESGGGWFHPIHIHLVDFYILTRNREEAQVHEYERFTPKDMVQLDPGAEVALLVRFGAHPGEYMFHCHNLMHEDFEMMRSFRVVPTPGSRTAATALPMQSDPTIVQSLNVVYDLYNDPAYAPASARPSAGLTPLRAASAATTAALSFPTDNGLYRIYYPNGSPNVNQLLANPAINPWRVNICQPQSPQQ
ncbi:hypothetical protein HXX76_003598 [Chlamydomonas incerta]|uniref:Plant heme peroxidase family profile domain-containing protein n=1 Tax=Chlamydomonas incerta TaxID=51695 RepID=A0A835W931_CHLIN|nr:hypothetical protein HXX76_003598 [Chlamydomonas incerta]|eukprot:KAG2440741.1 hypothetical protein HXX76_003598 [Chlamydomonas incerta]